MLKLMRPRAAFTYRIAALPAVPAVLEFLVAHAQLDARAAYSTFNMGAGLAVYCARGESAEVLACAERLGQRALLAGAVEEGPRRVLLEPLGVVYEGEELELSLER